MKKLILIQLNELNFDLVRKYPKKFKNLNYLLENGLVKNSSEQKYDLLEPWIQWVSVYTGKTATEHKIFRLGDVADINVEQIHEKIEKKGFSVGAILPMNLRNNLKKPKFFIPDPWTKTKSDGSFTSKTMHECLSYFVNNNSNKSISHLKIFTFFFIFLRFFRIKNSFKYIKYFLNSFKHKYRRAFFLDLFLNDVHIKMLNIKKPNFSSIFFNAGAHIQHHYLLNSKYISNEKSLNLDWYLPSDLDPFEESLELYDLILNDYIGKYNIVVATGLTQVPYDIIKFYYRLNNHKSFLKLLEVDYMDVLPRMTRDFLIKFNNQNSLKKAKAILENLELNGIKLFKEIEERSDSLFITLTYPKEINKNDKIFYNEKIINIHKYVSFVGLKNGKHSSESFTFFSPEIIHFKPGENSHVKEIYQSISNYFNEKN